MLCGDWEFDRYMSVTGERSPMIVREGVGGGGEVRIAMGQVGKGLPKADLPRSQHRGPEHSR